MHPVSSIGYRTDFFGPSTTVPPPKLSRKLKLRVAPVVDSPGGWLHYHNYSVLQHAGRGFPFWSCSNIDGGQWQQINRSDIFPGGSDHWKKDLRLDPAHQWGQELYLAEGSLFDRGHLTKREDVQWGLTRDEARAAAAGTFFFTNSVPQHKDLNRRVWARLEDYILQAETNPRNLRISVFTGPALRDDDPEFAQLIRDQPVLLPVWFWKLVYFLKSDGRLYRVGFLMNQYKLLERDGILRATATREIQPSILETRLFSDFKEAGTFQVNIPVIEKLAGLRFPPAIDPFTDRRPSELVLEETVIQPRQAPRPDEMRRPFMPEIKGLKL